MGKVYQSLVKVSGNNLSNKDYLDAFFEFIYNINPILENIEELSSGNSINSLGYTIVRVS